MVPAFHPEAVSHEQSAFYFIYNLFLLYAAEKKEISAQIIFLNSTSPIRKPRAGDKKMISQGILSI
jgi:hypothetical protein